MSGLPRTEPTKAISFDTGENVAEVLRPRPELTRIRPPPRRLMMDIALLPPGEQGEPIPSLLAHQPRGMVRAGWGGGGWGGGGGGGMARGGEGRRSGVRGGKKAGLMTAKAAGCAPASAVEGPSVGEGMAIRRMASDWLWLIVVVMSVCAIPGRAIRKGIARKAATRPPASRKGEGFNFIMFIGKAG